MTTFVLKNLPRLFDKYAVAPTEYDALVKSMMKIFSNFMAFSENPYFKSMNNLLSYCGLVDVRINASDNELPVP